MFGPRLIILQPTPYCNIRCSYCYLGHRDDRRLMSNDVIEAVREKIFRRLSPEAAPTVVWHAGEPTAAPIKWYEHAHRRLADVAPPRTSFAMQSNGVAIDEKWIDLFQQTNTNVSLSIDGPQRFHDERRRTRNGRPTWHLAMRALKRLQAAGFDPSVITVLHPNGLDCAQDYYTFYRDNGITQISCSVDELEGANKTSSFSGRDYKSAVTAFLLLLLEHAYRDGFPLHIREIERVSQILAGVRSVDNEQVEPWAAIIIAATGDVSTFSPELMEVRAPKYKDFVFGNIVQGDFPDFVQSRIFERCSREVASGISACKSTCHYFNVCGGGSPVNKFCENGNLGCTETEFCRLTTQTSADALLAFIAARGGAKSSFQKMNTSTSASRATTGGAN